MKVIYKNLYINLCIQAKSTIAVQNSFDILCKEIVSLNLQINTDKWKLKQ